MKNILKIVFLGIIGFGLLTYLTAPKNIEKSLNKSLEKSEMSINSIPRYFELVGNSPYTKFETMFPKGIEKYIKNSIFRNNRIWSFDIFNSTKESK